MREAGKLNKDCGSHCGLQPEKIRLSSFASCDQRRHGARLGKSEQTKKKSNRGVEIKRIDRQKGSRGVLAVVVVVAAIIWKRERARDRQSEKERETERERETKQQDQTRPSYTSDQATTTNATKLSFSII